jgi:hypothetical protein
VDVLLNSITITNDSISIRTKGGDVESHAYKYQNLAIILDNNYSIPVSVKDKTTILKMQGIEMTLTK